MKSLYSIVLYLMLFSLHAPAQDLMLSATASKSQVAVGEAFQIQYQFNGNGDHFRGPDLSAFTVLGGPNQSQSVQVINGRMSRSVIFSYIISAKTEGQFKIGPASIESDEGRINSNLINLLVSKQGASGNKSAEVDDKSIFIRASVSSGSPYKGEGLLLTYKIYTNVNILNYAVNKMPAFNGFWNRDIELPQQPQLESEVVDGKNYRVAVIKKMVLFPQKSGTLEIDPIELECIARIRVKSNRRGADPFGFFQNDPFFNDPSVGFGGVRDVKYSFRSNKLSIQVKELPAGAPDDFNGLVGNFQLEGQLSPETANVNDALTLKIKIKGEGNLNLAEINLGDLPPDLESFEPKINDRSIAGINGLSGSKSFDYLFIPRSPGDYELAPVSFSYFDPKQAKYIRRRTGPFSFKVEGGSSKTAGSGATSPDPVNRTEFRELSEDIRFIKTFEQSNGGGLTYGSPLFYLSSVLPFLALATAVWYRRRIGEENQNPLHLRRKSLSLVRKKMAHASSLIESGNNTAAIEEIEKVLYTFISQNFALKPADISRPAIAEAFRGHQVSQDLTESLLKLLDTCEQHRYGGGSPESAHEVYQTASGVLESIEKKLKHERPV